MKGKGAHQTADSGEAVKQKEIEADNQWFGCFTRALKADWGPKRRARDSATILLHGTVEHLER
jgi:hypothetical protein